MVQLGFASLSSSNGSQCIRQGISGDWQSGEETLFHVRLSPNSIVGIAAEALVYTLKDAEPDFVKIDRQ